MLPGAPHSSTTQTPGFQWGPILSYRYPAGSLDALRFFPALPPGAGERIWEGIEHLLSACFILPRGH